MLLLTKQPVNNLQRADNVLYSVTTMWQMFPVTTMWQMFPVTTMWQMFPVTTMWQMQTNTQCAPSSVW